MKEDSDWLYPVFQCFFIIRHYLIRHSCLLLYGGVFCCFTTKHSSWPPCTQVPGKALLISWLESQIALRLSCWLASFTYSCFHSFYRWGNRNKVKQLPKITQLVVGIYHGCQTLLLVLGTGWWTRDMRPLPSRSLHSSEPQLCISANCHTAQKHPRRQIHFLPSVTFSSPTLLLSLLSSSHSSSWFSSSFAFPRGNPSAFPQYSGAWHCNTAQIYLPSLHTSFQTLDSRGLEVRVFMWITYKLYFKNEAVI